MPVPGGREAAAWAMSSCASGRVSDLVEGSTKAMSLYVCCRRWVKAVEMPEVLCL